MFRADPCDPVLVGPYLLLYFLAEVSKFPVNFYIFWTRRLLAYREITLTPLSLDVGRDGSRHW